MDTMLDAAPPGRRWPALREAANLVRHRLRAQLGRPGNRAVLPLSVLTALVVGMFGAAIGSLLAWGTAGPLPGTPELRQVFHTAVPDPVTGISVDRDDYLFGYSGEKSAWRTFVILVSGIDDDRAFRPGQASMSGLRSPATDHHRYATAARDRMIAAGWQASPLTVHADSTCVDSTLCNQADTGTNIGFTARKGSTVLAFSVDRGQLVTMDGQTAWRPGPHGTQLTLSATLYRATPDLLPAEFIGGIAAALVCWLVFTWASRRTQHRSARTRLVVRWLYMTMLTLWTLPVILLLLIGFANLTSPPVTPPGDRWVPGVGLLTLFGFPGLWPEVLGGLAALLIIAVAALPASGGAGAVHRDRHRVS